MLYHRNPEGDPEEAEQRRRRQCARCDPGKEIKNASAFLPRRAWCEAPSTLRGCDPPEALISDAGLYPTSEKSFTLRIHLTIEITRILRQRLKQIRQLRKSVLHGNCMNIQTASAPRTSNIHSRCGKAFAKNVNSLRSDRTVFAHSTSFVHEEVLRLVQIV